LVFAAASVYLVSHLRHEEKNLNRGMLDGVVFTNTPETRLIAFYFLAVGFLICAMLASTLPIIWLSLQSSACVFAYLFYFRRYSKSLGLAWRFMTFIAISGLLSFIATVTVMVAIKHQDSGLAKVAFLFAFLGYGFLGAMAPMHFWVAEAHHESLPSVGVMLSCGLTLCGLLAMLRFLQTLFALGIGDWMKSFCIYAGFFSMFCGTLQLLQQKSYLRALAYSTVAQNGMILFGIGVGRTATFAALLHMVNHTILKSMLILLAGNFLLAYGSRTISHIRGAAQVIPISGVFWLISLTALAGIPPFGTFMSQFMLLRAIVEGPIWQALFFLGITILSFIGLFRLALPMSLGTSDLSWQREPRGRLGPILFLALCALTFGFFVPKALEILLERSAHLLGGQG
jgi:hydrogenase-4 component F